MKNTKTNTEIIINIIIVLLPLILGSISSLFVEKTDIPKPKTSLNPPSWLFGVVWPILYLLLGYSSYLIFRSNSSNKNKIFTIYIIHIILLSLWYPIFVNTTQKKLSFITILFLLFYAIYLSYLYSDVNKVASYCLIPYILWLSFASYLSYSSI